MALLEGKVAIITGASRVSGARSACASRAKARRSSARRARRTWCKETARDGQAGRRPGHRRHLRRRGGGRRQAHGRRGRPGIRQDRHPREQRGRRRPHQARGGLHDGGLALHDQLVPDQLLPVHALRRAGDGQGGRRVDHQHLLGRGPPRPALPHRLLLGQGGPGRHDVRHGARAGPARDPRELRRPGRRRGRSHRPGDRRTGRGARHPHEAMRKAMLERSPLRRMVDRRRHRRGHLFFTSDLARTSRARSWP